MTIRKKDHGNGLREELFATHTEIFWDPATNGGMIRFRTTNVTYLNDVPIAQQGVGMEEYALSSVLTRTFTVQTPNGPVEVPGMLIMGAMKEAFDVLINESAGTGPAPEPTE